VWATTPVTHVYSRRRGSSTMAVRNRGRVRSRGGQGCCFMRRRKNWTLLHRVPAAVDKGDNAVHMGACGGGAITTFSSGGRRRSGGDVVQSVRVHCRL
jgi:hypothetical protein